MRIVPFGIGWDEPGVGTKASDSEKFLEGKIVLPVVFLSGGIDDMAFRTVSVSVTVKTPVGR